MSTELYNSSSSPEWLTKIKKINQIRYSFAILGVICIIGFIIRLFFYQINLKNSIILLVFIILIVSLMFPIFGMNIYPLIITKNEIKIPGLSNYRIIDITEVKTLYYNEKSGQIFLILNNKSVVSIPR